MIKLVAVIMLAMVASTAEAACTRAKLAGEYMVGGTLSDGLDVAYVTARVILRAGGGMSLPFVHATIEGGEAEESGGSGGWSVNANCVGTMRIQGERYRFTATGTAPDDITLIINVVESFDFVSGQLIGQKKNL